MAAPAKPLVRNLCAEKHNPVWNPEAGGSPPLFMFTLLCISLSFPPISLGFLMLSLGCQALGNLSLLSPPETGRLGSLRKDPVLTLLGVWGGLENVTPEPPGAVGVPPHGQIGLDWRRLQCAAREGSGHPPCPGCG